MRTKLQNKSHENIKMVQTKGFQTRPPNITQSYCKGPPNIILHKNIDSVIVNMLFSNLINLILNYHCTKAKANIYFVLIWQHPLQMLYKSEENNFLIFHLIKNVISWKVLLILVRLNYLAFVVCFSFGAWKSHHHHSLQWYSHFFLFILQNLFHWRKYVKEVWIDKSVKTHFSFLVNLTL